MQPNEANLSVGIPSIIGPDHRASSDQRGGTPCIEAAVDGELLPTIAALQQIIDHPDVHTVGDLAALTDRLTSEMMLFSALVGNLSVHCRVALEPVPTDAPCCADAEQNSLHAEFLRDLAV